MNTTIYKNKYFENNAVKPIYLIKKLIQEHKLGNFKIKNKINIVKNNNNFFNLNIYNNTATIDYADYNFYYRFKNNINNLNYDLNVLLYKSNFKKIYIYWFLYYNKKYYPILLTKFIRNYLNEFSIKDKYLIKNVNYKISNEWVSASQTKNYSINDPLLDYLKYNNIYSVSDLILSPKKRKYAGDSDNNFKFQKILLDNGIQFEKKIVKMIDKKVKVTTIIEQNEYILNYMRDPVYYEITKLMMKLNVPIIYQGLLLDKKNKTFGSPDLIIKQNIFNKLFKNHNNKRINNSYYIVDIKNSTISYSVNDNILNYNLIRAYKTQICVYNNLLNKIQKKKNNIAYILSPKWVKREKKNIYSCNNPFNRLGVIDYKNNDKEFIPIAEKAIQWIKLIKTPNNNLNCLEPNNKNLYPNMSNYIDYPFREIKKYLSEKNYEITNLWMCGFNERKKALEHGVDNWKDINFSLDFLDFKNKKREIIENLIILNRSEEKKIYPDKILTNIFNWKDRDRLSFYVDFETINKSIFVNNNIDLMIYKNQKKLNDKIFMIGIGYSYKNKWNYKVFIENNLNIKNQKNLINQFNNYICKICSNYKVNYEDVNIYHWSNFENIIYKKICNKYNLNNLNLNWCNLIKLFKEEPILIKGSYNFSLKNIGKAMYENNLITTYWTDDECNNGFDAMTLAYNIYTKNFNILDNKVIRKIKNYNHIDCKIMWDILNGLKKYS